MLKVLTLLTRTRREKPAKKPRTVVATPTRPPTDFRAEAIVPGNNCCSAVKALAGKRYRLREVPHLPLAKCTMAASCLCTFKKAADRSGSDRRRAVRANASAPGPEKRKPEPRRSRKE